MSSTFFDAFFFWVAAAVAIITLIDWLIGAKARQRHRERLEDLWLYLVTTTYPRLVSDDAGRVAALGMRLLGQSPFRARFVLRVGFFTTIVSLIAIGICLPLSGMASRAGAGSVPGFGSGYWTFLRLLFPELGVFLFLLFLLAIFFNWLSVAFAMGLLKRMARTSRWHHLLFWSILDIVGLVVITVGTVTSAAVLLSTPIAYFINLSHFALFMVAANVIVSLLPTVAHFMLGILLLVSKLLLPILKKPVELLALRLSESPKGVLTTAAIGLGSAAKLLQQAAKLYLP